MEYQHLTDTDTDLSMILSNCSPPPAISSTINRKLYIDINTDNNIDIDIDMDIHIMFDTDINTDTYNDINIDNSNADASTVSYTHACFT